jgi:NAD(P)-dependent dehydrogenase (short-subunit alcohol dehydrogenase family)
VANNPAKVALVTGASRGIGRGIAQALGERGCEVWLTGRTSGAGELTIEATAALVDAAGGRGRPVRCDHGSDADVGRLFERIRADAGHIDYLINNVYRIPNPPVWGGGFWEHPISIWEDQVGIGLRAHYVASWHAAPLLFEAGPGAAIVNVSSPGGLAYHFSCSYGVDKAGLDRLTADMAIELAPRGVTAVALYPGSVSTEFVRDMAGAQGRDLTDAQTPLFVGRAVAALLAAPDLANRSGSIQWVEDQANEFDLVDVHDRRPPGYPRRAQLERRA